MGLIFLKYISDSFEELYAKLTEGKGEYEDANPEDKDEYKAEKVASFIPLKVLSGCWSRCWNLIMEESLIHVAAVAACLSRVRNLLKTTRGDWMTFLFTARRAIRQLGGWQK